LIALHPLALESTAFAGVGRLLAGRGLRTLAVDLPGFGRTPAPEGRLTPARLAAPVVELARSLETPPLLLGFSLGGRVALEAALTAPEAFRAVVLVAPALPWRRGRWALPVARFLDPDFAARVPLERAWPALKRIAETLEAVPSLEHDWLARAAIRVVYYSSCAATRKSFISAARELALDPAFGRGGLWARLPGLQVPAVFLWAGRDRLIPHEHARAVAKVLRGVRQLEVPCSGHFVNGAHFRCLEHAMDLAVGHALDEVGDASRAPRPHKTRSLTPCLAGARTLPGVAAAEGGELNSPVVGGHP
jgi:pimeloyl-ACP methyl ester carboxylesterase